MGFVFFDGMVWKICEDNDGFVIVTIVLNEGFVVVVCQGNVGWLFLLIIFDLFNYLKEKWNEKHTANEYMLKPGMKPILNLY